MEILTAAQMAEADRITIEAWRIPVRRLMENAGRAVADKAAGVAETVLKKRKPRTLIVCGKGNNGGDGLVAARLLRRRGWPVHVSQIWREALPNDATLRRCDLVIDALFGTGLGRPLTGEVRALVERINASGKPVLAVDIPSGIDATTGRVFGTAIRARWTVTFARAKRGHILDPGSRYCGELTVADIGIPDEAVLDARPDAFLIDAREAARLLPARPDDSHKGRFGRCAIVATSRGMIGAGILAAESAMRAGAGLTTLYVPESIYPIAAKKLSPEAMCEPIPDRGRGAFGPESTRVLLSKISNASTVLVGPGLGRHRDTIRFVQALLHQMTPSKKWILDADALFAVAAAKPTWGGPRKPVDVALTPHAGEMARLLRTPRSQIERDVCRTAGNYSKTTGATVVLKGSQTVIAAAGAPLALNNTGNAALAKGGSGDVLAGLICGFCSQGLRTFDAACLGAYLLGRTADLAVQRGQNRRTFVASDVFRYLDAAISELED